MLVSEIMLQQTRVAAVIPYYQRHQRPEPAAHPRIQDIAINPRYPCGHPTAAEPLAAWGLTAREWRKKLEARHIFTHVEWHMTGYVLTAAGDGEGAGIPRIKARH